MTIDDVKEELKRYEHDCKLIEDIENEVEFYNSKLLSCTSQISAMPKGDTELKDKMAEYIARLEVLEIEKYTRLIELENRKELVECTIAKLKQPYRRLLHLAYIQEWTHCDENGAEKVEIGYGLHITASVMSYTYKHTCRLHGKALQEYLEEREKDVLQYETSKRETQNSLGA